MATEGCQRHQKRAGMFHVKPSRLTVVSIKIELRLRCRAKVGRNLLLVVAPTYAARRGASGVVGVVPHRSSELTTGLLQDEFEAGFLAGWGRLFGYFTDEFRYIHMSHLKHLLHTCNRWCMHAIDILKHQSLRLQESHFFFFSRRLNPHNKSTNGVNRVDRGG